jgi:hypothetical protein
MFTTKGAKFSKRKPQKGAPQQEPPSVGGSCSGEADGVGDGDGPMGPMGSMGSMEAADRAGGAYDSHASHKSHPSPPRIRLPPGVRPEAGGSIEPRGAGP